MSNNLIKLEGCKVLVVDDKKENLELLTQVLEQKNYEVAFAMDGEKAIQIATLFLPDLILLDVMMPGIDGFETCRRLKSLSELQDIPVIFVTACTHVNDLSEAFSCGAVDYVTKPIREAEILARVATHLQLRNLLLLRDKLITQLREQNIELDAFAKQQEKQLEESEKLNHLGELVGELSHELGTPLGVTVTALSGMQDHFTSTEEKLNKQILSKQDLESCMAFTKEAMTIMSANLQHANQLVKSFKSIVVGEFCDENMSVNLLEYLNEIKMLLRPKLKRTPHKVNIECNESISYTGQVGALSQILLNLVNNALIHAFKNSAAGEVNICATLSATHLEIIIADNGKGMDEITLQSAFDKYYTTRRGLGGSGLGLYIVEKIIKEKLNGEILLKSTPSIGCQFTLKIPV